LREGRFEAERFKGNSQREIVLERQLKKAIKEKSQEKKGVIQK